MDKKIFKNPLNRERQRLCLFSKSRADRQTYLKMSDHHHPPNTTVPTAVSAATNVVESIEKMVEMDKVMAPKCMVDNT